MERSTILGSFSVAGAAVEGVGEGGGMRCASATAPAVSSTHSRKLPVGSRPPPAQQREALHRIACFQFWVRQFWGNWGEKLFEQDFGDYTILLCVEWDSDIGSTNLDQFELRLISSDSCIWSKLKMWEKQKCEMWKVNQIDTNRAPVYFARTIRLPGA